MSVGYFHPSQRGLVFVNRQLDSGERDEEGRPNLNRGAEHGLHGVWDDMKSDVPEMARIFRLYEGSRQFYDSGEVVAGVWHDAGESLCDVFGATPDLRAWTANAPRGT